MYTNSRYTSFIAGSDLALCVLAWCAWKPNSGVSPRHFSRNVLFSINMSPGAAFMYAVEHAGIFPECPTTHFSQDKPARDNV